MSWLRKNAGVIWPTVLTVAFAVAAMFNDIFALAAANPAAFATFGAAACCFGFLVGKIVAEQSKEAAAERARDKDRAAAAEKERLDRKLALERERLDRESAERIAAKQAEEETKREQMRLNLERKREYWRRSDQEVERQKKTRAAEEERKRAQERERRYFDSCANQWFEEMDDDEMLFVKTLIDSQRLFAPADSWVNCYMRTSEPWDDYIVYEVEDGRVTLALSDAGKEAVASIAKPLSLLNPVLRRCNCVYDPGEQKMPETRLNPDIDWWTYTDDPKMDRDTEEKEFLSAREARLKRGGL